jgi:hypothetical protein
MELINVIDFLVVIVTTVESWGELVDDAIGEFLGATENRV